MSYDPHYVKRETKRYLDFLDKFGDKINRMSDKPLDEIVDFIQDNGPQSPAIVDLMFAVGLVKAPEEILIEIKTRKREVYLSLGVHSKPYHRVFIEAEIPGKGRITDQAAREALLSIKPGLYFCHLNLPEIIREAEEIVRTCKIERW